MDNITYVPVTSTYPAALSWGINATSCIYGEIPIFLTSTAGTVDTGYSRASSLHKEDIDLKPRHSRGSSCR